MKHGIGRAEVWVGAFVCLALGGAALFLVLRARSEGWLGGKDVIVHLDQGYGITPGTVVKVRGLKAGAVRSVGLVEGAHVKVVMRVDSGFREWVRRDSRVRILTAFLLGNTEIEITPGSREAPPVPDGGELLTDAGGGQLADLSGEISRTAQDLHQTLARAQDVLASVDGLASDLRGGKGAVGELVQSTRSVVDTLKPAGERAAAIAESTEKILKNLEPASERAVAIAESTEKVMKNLEPTSANIARSSEKVVALLDTVETEVRRLGSEQANVEAITTELKAAAEHIRSILAKIDRGEGTAGKLISEDSLYQKAEEAVEATRDLVQSVRRTETYVLAETNGYDRQDLFISTVGLRIVPSPSRYFFLGAAIYSPLDTSPVVVPEEDDLTLKPEFLIAQKAFDDQVTFRGGLLEGGLGGGVDYELPDAWGQLFVEGRGAFDDPEEIDERIDGVALLRAGAAIRLSSNFRLQVVVDNLADSPALGVGLSFEYLDKDITKVVGLLGAAN